MSTYQTYNLDEKQIERMLTTSIAIITTKMVKDKIISIEQKEKFDSSHLMLVYSEKTVAERFKEAFGFGKKAEEGNASIHYRIATISSEK